MRTKNISKIILIAALLSLSANGFSRMTDILNDATVAVRVVDDDGSPLEGVVAEYYSLSDRDKNVMTSDANGIVLRRMKNIYFEIRGSFRKDGYYKTSGRFWKWDKTGGVPPASTNFTIVMKRIENPVPMTSRNISTDLPATDEEVFFDLAIGDWVAPYGKGKLPDISFFSSLQFETRDNFKVEISATFNGSLCGIQSFLVPSKADRKVRSQLIPLQLAPTNGYEKTLSLWFSYNPEERIRTHENPDNNYMFRTRVVTNAVGGIVSANYAWTDGEIKVNTNDGKKPWIGFTYYYNPDPTSRSLEPKEIADQQAKDIPELAK